MIPLTVWPQESATTAHSGIATSKRTQERKERRSGSLVCIVPAGILLVIPRPSDQFRPSCTAMSARLHACRTERGIAAESALHHRRRNDGAGTKDHSLLIHRGSRRPAPIVLRPPGQPTIPDHVGDGVKPRAARTNWVTNWGRATWVGSITPKLNETAGVNGRATSPWAAKDAALKGSAIVTPQPSATNWQAIAESGVCTCERGTP